MGVTHRVVFGTRLAIEQVLARWGWTINTAFVERLNLDIRQSCMEPQRGAIVPGTAVAPATDGLSNGDAR